MPVALRRVRPGGKPAVILLGLAKRGPTGMTAREFLLLGISLAGSKASAARATNQLYTNRFFERRVYLTQAGRLEAQRLAAECGVRS
jgi:hypothetical protein